MASYIVRRLLLVPFTLWAIFTLSFLIIQTAPGGPIEAFVLQLQGLDVNLASRQFGEAGGSELAQSQEGGSGGVGGETYGGRLGLEPRVIAAIEERYGLDRPLYERYFTTLSDYLRFDFGDSLFRGDTVVGLFIDKMPVSISLGFWSFVLGLLISIPLGIWKARRDGTTGDSFSTSALIAVDAVPAILAGIVLLYLFANPDVLDWFPRRGLVSDDFAELSVLGKIRDYFWHLALPVATLLMGSYAAQTLFVKNAFLDQLRMPYVTTARAKGLGEGRVLLGHVFRNAMLLPLAGLPAALFGVLVTGIVFIETIFTLDGLGLLGLKALEQRDYPVIFAQIWVFGLIGLLLNLVTDLTYTLIDPRINFDATGRRSA